MPDRVSHSSSWLPTEDRQLIEFDLYLKIATQIKHFFEYDLNNFPLEMEGKILRVEFEISGLDPLNWLAKQTSDVKTYWVDRSAGTVLVVPELRPCRVSLNHMFNTLEYLFDFVSVIETC